MKLVKDTLVTIGIIAALVYIIPAVVQRVINWQVASAFQYKNPYTSGNEYDPAFAVDVDNVVINGGNNEKVIYTVSNTSPNKTIGYGNLTYHALNMDGTPSAEGLGMINNLPPGQKDYGEVGIYVPGEGNASGKVDCSLRAIWHSPAS
jgi:hypothetical protein